MRSNGRAFHDEAKQSEAFRALQDGDEDSGEFFAFAANRLSFRGGNEVFDRITALVAHIVLGYPDNMTLKVFIHSAEEGGYWAEVPALPGCVSQGETMDE